LANRTRIENRDRMLAQGECGSPNRSEKPIDLSN